MDRFRALEVFVKVAGEGSFAAAARALAISPPAVTRAVSGLEARLGTRLLVRTTRSLRLTDSGRRFLADSQRILADLAAAEDAAVGAHAAPRGELRITAPVLFGRMFVVPVLGDFLDRHPRVGARTLFVDRVVNLMDEGLDVAVRIGHLPDSALTAVRAGSVRRVFVASPAYLAKHGRPRHPADLAWHRLVQSVAVDAARDWPYREGGRPGRVRIEPRLRVNTNDAAVDLAVRGQGISRLLSYQVAGLLADGRLTTVLDEFGLPPLPIHVVHQEGRMVSSRLRAFVDFMVERLRADPAIG